MVKIKTLRPVQQSTENRDLGFLKPIRIETSPATAFPVRPVANYGGEGAGNSVLTGVLYVVARCGFVFSARPSWTTVAQWPRRIHHVGEAADTITQAAAGQMMREKLFVIPLSYAASPGEAPRDTAQFPSSILRQSSMSRRDATR